MRLAGLTPGVYTAGTSVSGHYGGVAFDVGGSDVDNVVITVDSGLTINGRVVVEGETKESLSSLRIRFQPGWVVQTPVFEGPGNPVTKDLTFRETNMSPGVYRVEMKNMPDSFYLKTVREGTVDVTYTGLDLRSGTNDEIEVLLSPKAGVVSGIVQSGEKNEPTPGVTIVLVPKEKERQQIPLYYAEATTDQFGRFTLKNLAPGEYKAFAWEDVESTAWMDPEFMAPLAGKGVPVTVSESGQLNISVQLITAVSK